LFVLSGPFQIADQALKQIGQCLDLIIAHSRQCQFIAGINGRIDGDLLPRSVWMLPEGHSWPRTPGVTLIGDAAHLMSPFAGEGANLAMIDGADLAGAIIAHPHDIERGFAAYEATMFPRAREAAAQSAAGLELAFEPNAALAMLDFFTPKG
jgi:flavin-dependent dehydrogenase